MAEQNGFYVPQRALVVAAHADDIEFGLAGTVARWVEAGATVSYCIVTDNSSGSNEPGADLDALVKTRREEQTAAAAIVGVTDLYFLGYKDGTLQPTLELRRDITRLIRKLRPQVVVISDPTMVMTPDGGYINHPDHRAAAEAALYATFPSAETRPIFPELLDEGLEPHKVNKVYMNFGDHPTLYVDISTTWEKKAAALLCHKSQVNEEAVKMVGQWNHQTGQTIGTAYAEAFRVLNLNDIEDPAQAASE
jgi:LmbE family N-acetylglucosaminyl deacetylase